MAAAEVQLHGGRYLLSETFTFGEKDARTTETPLTSIAFQEREVVGHPA